MSFPNFKFTDHIVSTITMTFFSCVVGIAYVTSGVINREPEPEDDNSYLAAAESKEAMVTPLPPIEPPVHEIPEPMPEEPLEPIDTEIVQQFDEEMSTPEKPTAEYSQTDPNEIEKQIPDHFDVPPIAPVEPGSQTVILEGENAPSFACSLDECQRIARIHGGIFVLKIGKQFYRMGKSLDSSQLTLLDPTWHRSYAKRMARVEMSEANRRRLLRLGQRYQNIDVPSGILLLSISHRLDQIIFEAQQQWFQRQGRPIDVDSVTQGRFEDCGGNLEFMISAEWRCE